MKLNFPYEQLIRLPSWHTVKPASFEPSLKVYNEDGTMGNRGYIFAPINELSRGEIIACCRDMVAMCPGKFTGAPYIAPNVPRLIVTYVMWMAARVYFDPNLIAIPAVIRGWYGVTPQSKAYLEIPSNSTSYLTAIDYIAIENMVYTPPHNAYSAAVAWDNAPWSQEFPAEEIVCLIDHDLNWPCIDQDELTFEI